MVFHTNSRGQNNKQKRATRVLYRSLIALCMSIILNKYIISLVHLCVNRNFRIFRKYFILPFFSYVFREFHSFSVFISLFCARFGTSVVFNVFGFPCTILSGAAADGRRRSIRSGSRLPVKLEKPVISYEITG